MPHIKLRDIKKGDIIEESAGYGQACVSEAIEDARRIDEENKNGWTCKVKFLSGDTPIMDENGIVELFEAVECGAYGLRLFKLEDNN